MSVERVERTRLPVALLQRGAEWTRLQTALRGYEGKMRRVAGWISQQHAMDGNYPSGRAETVRGGSRAAIGREADSEAAKTYRRVLPKVLVNAVQNTDGNYHTKRVEAKANSKR